MSDKAVALGADNFAEFSAADSLYVDKTLLISEILQDKAKVVLITRPRRWAKTFAMSTHSL